MGVHAGFFAAHRSGSPLRRATGCRPCAPEGVVDLAPVLALTPARHVALIVPIRLRCRNWWPVEQVLVHEGVVAGDFAVQTASVARIGLDRARPARVRERGIAGKDKDEPVDLARRTGRTPQNRSRPRWRRRIAGTTICPAVIAALQRRPRRRRASGTWRWRSVSSAKTLPLAPRNNTIGSPAKRRARVFPAPSSLDQASGYQKSG